MKLCRSILFVILTILTACTKDSNQPSVPKSDTIDGYSITQVDSIARHYGWTFTLGDSSKSKKIVKIQDFIKLAELRAGEQHNTKKIKVETLVTLESTELGDFPSDGSTMAGLQYQPPNFNLTWKFPTLKSQGFPSLYNMTFTITSTGADQPQIGGADFMYDGVDGPVATSDWSYGHQGSSISGTANGFYVQNYGVAHETIHILGGTIQNHYLVKFNIDNGRLVTGTSIVLAYIRLTKLN